MSLICIGTAVSTAGVAEADRRADYLAHWLKLHPGGVGLGNLLQDCCK